MATNGFCGAVSGFKQSNSFRLYGFFICEVRMTITIPITEYRNAKVIEADGSRIDVEINHPEAGWIPYTLDITDTDMTIDNDALLELIGDDKEPFVGQTEEQIREELEANVRIQRNFLLAEMDQVISNQIRFDAMPN